MSSSPEEYYFQPTKYSPNSVLPALIYRDVLPLPLSAETATEVLERHGWQKRGDFRVVKIRHFHPNTHECYGVYSGESTLLLGVGGNDDPAIGTVVEVRAGDVVVVPAGLSHSSIDASADYRYIGLYPNESPKWRNELGKETVDHAAFRKEIAEVQIPVGDPVSGSDGPLPRIWSERWH